MSSKRPLACILHDITADLDHKDKKSSQQSRAKQMCRCQIQQTLVSVLGLCAFEWSRLKKPVVTGETKGWILTQ